MRRNTPLWILIVLLIVVIILVAPRGLTYGRGTAMHSGYGMMDHRTAGYGMMNYGMTGFGWILPVILLVLVIAAGVWLGNLFSSRKGFSRDQQAVCPKCSKPTDEDWTTCPYCSGKLK